MYSDAYLERGACSSCCAPLCRRQSQDDGGGALEEVKTTTALPEIPRRCVASNESTQGHRRNDRRKRRKPNKVARGNGFLLRPWPEGRHVLAGPKREVGRAFFEERLDAFLRVGAGGEVADALQVERHGVERILGAQHAPHQPPVDCGGH